MSGLELIRGERERQISAEEWSFEHDDGHRGGELALAGLCYERIADVQAKYGVVPADIDDAFTIEPRGWPWEARYFKLGKTAQRTYEKAGALLQAEVDRINRCDEDTKNEWIRGTKAWFGHRLATWKGGAYLDDGTNFLMLATQGVERIAAKIDALLK